MQGQVDIIDILLKLVIFATFVIFGIAMLFIKKQKKEKDKGISDKLEGKREKR